MSAAGSDFGDLVPPWAARQPRLERAWRRAFELDRPLNLIEPRLDVLQARVLLFRNQVGEALPMLERACTVLAEVRDHEGLCTAKLALARLSLHTLDLAQSEERAREALDLARRSGLRPREADAWIAIARVLHAMKRAAELEQALAEAQRIVDETDYRSRTESIERLRGGGDAEARAQARTVDPDRPGAAPLA